MATAYEGASQRATELEGGPGIVKNTMISLDPPLIAAHLLPGMMLRIPVVSSPIWKLMTHMYLKSISKFTVYHTGVQTG